MSKSIPASDTAHVTLTKGTLTLQLTRTASRQCDDFAPALSSKDMVAGLSSTQPYLVHNPQSGDVLAFIIPREVFASSSINLTIYFSYPQFLRSGLPQALLSYSGPSFVTGRIINRTTLVVTLSAVSVPSSITKFVDLFLAVNISRDNFVCGDRWVNLIVGISIQAASRALDASSQNAVANAAAAATLAGANPGAAATQARTKMLSALVTCSFDLAADNGNSITGLSFGTSKGQYYRGSVVGNWLLFLFFTAGLLLIAYTCARIIHRRHGLRMQEAWVSMQCVLHIPSGCLVPLGLVLQPTVSSTLTLIMYPTSSSDAILAAASIFGCLALFCYVLTISVFRFQCKLVHGTDAESKPSDAATPFQVFTHYAMVFFEGTDQWKTLPGHDPLWKKRYHLVFNDYRYKWYAVCELSVSIAMGLVNGAKVDSSNGCFVQLCFMLALYGLLFLIAIIARPGISWFAQLFLFLSNGIGLACCVLIVVGITANSDAAFAYSDYLVLSLSIMSSVVSLKDIVKLIFLLPIVVRYVATLQKHAALKTDEEIEEEQRQVLEIIGVLNFPQVGLQGEEEEGHRDVGKPGGEIFWGSSSPMNRSSGGRQMSPRRKSKDRQKSEDAFSFETEHTVDMDLRTLPSIPRSDGDSQSSYSSVDDLRRIPTQTLPSQPRPSNLPNARSLWEAFETGAPLADDRTEDPFARQPSIWRAFSDGPQAEELEVDEAQERRRRRRRKTRDFDDLL